MRTTLSVQTVVPIDWIEKSDHWGLVPAGRETKGAKRRFRALTIRKGNCAFTRDVPRGMIEFIYRATVRLGLRKNGLAFMRGTVRRGGITLSTAVSVRELGWGMGSAVVIPRTLRFREHITLAIDGKRAGVRVMELIVLNALLHLARPGQKPDWYAALAASVMVCGWKSLERTDMPRVERIDDLRAGQSSAQSARK
jgi:hypothetical protein